MKRKEMQRLIDVMLDAAQTIRINQVQAQGCGPSLIKKPNGCDAAWKELNAAHQQLTRILSAK